VGTYDRRTRQAFEHGVVVDIDVALIPDSSALNRCRSLRARGVVVRPWGNLRQLAEKPSVPHPLENFGREIAGRRQTRECEAEMAEVPRIEGGERRLVAGRAGTAEIEIGCVHSCELVVGGLPRADALRGVCEEVLRPRSRATRFVPRERRREPAWVFRYSSPHRSPR
jgi:hypothetical protein